MNAIKFDADIRDGLIRIPGNRQARLGKRVRVIVLSHEDSGEYTLIDQLLQTPLSLPAFSPLKRDEIHASWR